MSRKSSQPVTGVDLETFVNSDSSFALEMQTLAELTGAGYTCQHSGTYSDPVTDKTRQFDIRAHLAVLHPNAQVKVGVSLAVECKRLDSTFPLLISATSRRPAESFVHVATRQGGTPQLHPTSRPTAYWHNEPTGRKLDQVGKDKEGIFGNDADVFDKAQQAVNSCYDLIREAFRGHGGVVATVVVPVLVVPAGTLWQVTYNDTGTMTEKPHEVERACLFMDHRWNVPIDGYGPIAYSLSHLEIVVEGTLARVGARFLDGNQFPAIM